MVFYVGGILSGFPSLPAQQLDVIIIIVVIIVLPFTEWSENSRDWLLTLLNTFFFSFFNWNTLIIDFA